MEGKPSESLSFFVGRPMIVQDFTKIQDYWWVSRRHSYIDNIFLGKSDLVIDYSDYQFELRQPEVRRESSRCRQLVRGRSISLPESHKTKNSRDPHRNRGRLHYPLPEKPDLVVHAFGSAVAAGPAGADFFSGISQTIASVVSIRPAIDAAFCRAERVTFAGSITPDFTRSSYSSV